MSTAPHSPLTGQDDVVGLKREWLWFLVLGVGLIVIGTMAIGSAFIATLATVTVFGVLMLAGGIVQTISAFWSPRWSGILLHALIGILYAVVGFMLLDDPLKGAAGLTLIIAAFFIAGGIVRIVATLMFRFRNWAWPLLNGVVTLLLGVIIWRNLPEISFVIIGIFVGIELIFNGWAWVMFALAVRNLDDEAPRS